MRQKTRQGRSRPPGRKQVFFSGWGGVPPLLGTAWPTPVTVGARGVRCSARCRVFPQDAGNRPTGFTGGLNPCLPTAEKPSRDVRPEPWRDGRAGQHPYGR